MRRELLQGSLIVTVALTAARAWTYPDYARTTKVACAGCHVNPAGGADLTDAGKLFKTDHAKVPKAVPGAAYAGIGRCKLCHARQYTSWQKTKHAQALANLKSADPKAVEAMAHALQVELEGPPAEAAQCVKCHVTGFELEGGYPAADSLRNAALENVTCEACHGPGSKHASAPLAEKKKLIHRGVTANTCMQCHTRQTSPKFKFEEYKKLGVHALRP
ncbi:MAG: hypothetical protein E6K78_11415 [Candidatus Eisenbacteria bacterium]|uniref:Cytochrome c-552/4 domain-containing protein n=1 Tax=Eiseniibacteriota bacterium TaxID=2212470 RepID=A0A538TG79_UNCEI|nr:MAG: hypothetical protein E6K78_11415 [Candidatus Eisenbacteria bacterium]